MTSEPERANALPMRFKPGEDAATPAHHPSGEVAQAVSVLSLLADNRPGYAINAEHLKR